MIHRTVFASMSFSHQLAWPSHESCIANDATWCQTIVQIIIETNYTWAICRQIEMWMIIIARRFYDSLLSKKSRDECRTKLNDVDLAKMLPMPPFLCLFEAKSYQAMQRGYTMSCKNKSIVNKLCVNKCWNAYIQHLQQCFTIRLVESKRIWQGVAIY